MPGVARPGDLSEIVAEMQDELRRLRRAAGASQNDIWKYDTFTITGAGDTTHTLSFIPKGINVALLNKSGLTEVADYTCDYTTGIITVLTAVAAGNVLHVRYVTTAELMVYSTTPLTGAIVDTFNRPDNLSLLTTSDGQATWTDVLGNFRVTSNQAVPRVLSGGSSWAVSTVPGGSANGTLQVTIPTLPTSGSPGVAFRVQDGSNIWFWAATLSSISLDKVVAGTIHGAGTVTHTLAAGDKLSVVMSGSSIAAQLNGTTVASTTDSFNSTVQAMGIFGAAFDDRIDDFSFLPA